MSKWIVSTDLLDLSLNRSLGLFGRRLTVLPRCRRPHSSHSLARRVPSQPAARRRAPRAPWAATRPRRAPQAALRAPAATSAWTPRTIPSNARPASTRPAHLQAAQRAPVAGMLIWPVAPAVRYGTSMKRAQPRWRHNRVAYFAAMHSGLLLFNGKRHSRAMCNWCILKCWRHSLHQLQRG